MLDGCNVPRKIGIKKKEKREKTLSQSSQPRIFLLSTRLLPRNEFHALDGSNFNVGVNVINAYQLPPPPPAPLFIRCIDRAQPSGAIRIRGSINIMSINQRHPATWKRSFVSLRLRKKHPLLKHDPITIRGDAN